MGVGGGQEERAQFRGKDFSLVAQVYAAIEKVPRTEQYRVQEKGRDMCRRGPLLLRGV
jgi:hypothetical protein